MKKTVIRIVGILAFIIIALLAWISTLPEDFSTEMSMDIKASPTEISPLIHNMETYQTWSPWNELDPTIKTTVGNPVEGVGANASWISEKSGNGTMTVVELKDDFIKIDLDFQEQGRGISEWHLDQNGDITKVTWVFKGKAETLTKKAFSLIVSKMMRKPFALGLNNLKEQAEK